MTNVVDITDRSPNPALIEMLERLLGRARAGDLRSVIYASAGTDGATGHGWAIDDRSWRQPLLAEMMIVQNEMMLAMSAATKTGVLRDLLE